LAREKWVRAPEGGSAWPCEKMNWQLEMTRADQKRALSDHDWHNVHQTSAKIEPAVAQAVTAIAASPTVRECASEGP